MRKFVLLILTTLIFSSCDCKQDADGVVLDKQTKEPVENVSLGKYEKKLRTMLIPEEIFPAKKEYLIIIVYQAA